MAIKLYGAPGSTATLRVRACLAEKDLDYEFVNVDMGAKEHKKPEFLSRNPFGQVPAFEDGDLKLFESRAITQYIAHAYADKGNDLIIKDVKKMAIQSVWMEVESQKYEPATSKLIWELCLKPMWGMPVDEAVAEENEKKLEDVLDIYESRLSESKYLGGDGFTLADLHHLPNLKYLMGTKVKKVFDARPHVSAWASEILSRPAWVKATATVA
ncbi:glutathione S-transferase APIC-like [Cynara cardunculus var. scolymus]|nr:glutathione S-transferase APIC-like [Cynara cardunculus var. scolymus]